MLPLLIVMQVVIVALFLLITIPDSHAIGLALLAGFIFFDAGLILYGRRSGSLLNLRQRLAIIFSQMCLVVLVLLGRWLKHYVTGL